MENQEITEETKVFYDKRENQKIPLISVANNKVWHHLKPLTDESHFNFAVGLEKVEYYQPKKLKDIYKPQFELWRELFIEREGEKEKNSDVLFTEAVQAINALVYFQKFDESNHVLEEGFLFDDDANIQITFGAMLSGIFVELSIEYKSDFDSLTDDYLDANRRKGRPSGLGFKPINKASQIFDFAKNYLKNSQGFEKSENLIDCIPAWQIIKTADAIFEAQIKTLTASPLIIRINQ